MSATDSDTETNNAAHEGRLLRLVERWMEAARRIDDTFGKIEKAFMASPENEVRSAIWGMFGEYTKTVAALVGDEENWLEWFAWECDFGKRPMEMKFSDGETLMVVGASDLLAAIRTDENGCRVWDSPANASDAPCADARHGNETAK